MKNSLFSLSLLAPVLVFGMILSSSPELTAQTAALSAVRKKLVEAKTEQEKAEAEQELRKEIDDFFGADMKRRTAELEKVKQHVGQMELHLTKRVSAKTEIIELQLKSFFYEADGLGLFGTTSSGAIGNPPPARLTSQQQQDPFFARRTVYPPARKIAGGRSKPKPKGRVDQLREKLAVAKTEEGRAEVRDDLKKAMNEYFEEDVKRRQSELEEIRNRIDKMDTHLARRRSAKRDIVDLQVEMMVKDAAGLGFFGGTSDIGSPFRYPRTDQPSADPFAGDSRSAR